MTEPNWEAACKTESNSRAGHQRADIGTQLLLLVARKERDLYKATLEDIEAKGHGGGYHGKGYSLATIAKEILNNGNK